MSILPERIDTARLALRPWRADDAADYIAVVTANLDHLRTWMPWAMNEPSPLPVLHDQLQLFADRFAADQDWLYAIEAAPATVLTLTNAPAPHLLGGIGVHPRTDEGRVTWSGSRGVPPTVEVGYWLRREACRCGYMVEATSALVTCLFEALGVERVEIRCDPRNLASIAVPRRLGLSREALLDDAIDRPDGTRGPAEVWCIDATRWRTARAAHNPRASA